MAALWVKTLTDTRRCSTRKEALAAQAAGYRWMSDNEYAAWIRRLIAEVTK